MPLGTVITECVATAIVWVFELFWQYFIGSLGRWVIWISTLGRHEVSKESWTAVIAGILTMIGMAVLFVILS
jgi:hypothetical protein